MQRGKVTENFQIAFRNMLAEIRNFMRKYNKLDRPLVRYKFLHAFAEHLKEKSV